MDIHKVRAEFLKSIRKLMNDFDFEPTSAIDHRANGTTQRIAEEVLTVGIRSGLISEAIYIQVRRGFITAPKVTEAEVYRLLSIIDCHLEYCEAGRSEVAGQ